MKSILEIWQYDLDRHSSIMVELWLENKRIAINKGFDVYIFDYDFSFIELLEKRLALSDTITSITLPINFKGTTSIVLQYTDKNMVKHLTLRRPTILFWLRLKFSFTIIQNALRPIRKLTMLRNAWFVPEQASRLYKLHTEFGFPQSSVSDGSMVCMMTRGQGMVKLFGIFSGRIMCITWFGQIFMQSMELVYMKCPEHDDDIFQVRKKNLWRNCWFFHST